MNTRQLSDQTIRQEFERARKIIFSARPNNRVEWRRVKVGDRLPSLPFQDFLLACGVTPQALRPVFNPQLVWVKRLFPFCFGWWGLNKKTRKMILRNLPQRVKGYDELGSFSLDSSKFQLLSSVIGKPIEVLREDGGTGEHYPLFTSLPDDYFLKS